MIITVSEVPKGGQVVIAAEGRSVIIGDGDRATVTPEPTRNLVRTRERRAALDAMRAVLEGWVEIAKQHHQAQEHRDEMEPCWEQFHTADIRRMINDACVEVGVNPYAEPK